MRQRIKNLIENEDKKNPLTDEAISSMLNIRREDVTFLRNELKIEDSRQRRKVVLIKAIKDILKEEKTINKNDITRRLNSIGFTVSRFTVIQYLKELQDSDNLKLYKESDDKKEEINNNRENTDIAFDKLIGSSGSLSTIIKLAKAAILYPPHGLHTIIMGPTGVGKSELAECMYKFALESSRFPKNAPFIVFNAADYSENPQLLLSQLFGHVKGAFTGADESKEGLVSKADGGILFIDEIHRLPHEGQEILFQLIDKGMVRKLGETKLTNKIDVMIISATSEPIDSHLLNTFKRRIPVTIEIPELVARPLNERFDIINNFFLIEAQRMGANIHIKSDVLKALMLYDCIGNVGQLRSDIQVACARGLLNQLTNKQKEVNISISDVPGYVKQGLIKIRNCRGKIENYVDGDLIIDSNLQGEIEKKNEDIYTFPDEIYKLTERRHIDLLEQGLDFDVINRIVGGELESCIQKYIKQVKKVSISNNLPDISPIVGKYIVELTYEVIKIASQYLNSLEPNLHLCLAVHLKAAFERLKEGKVISNAHLKEIIGNYPLEYSVAEKVAQYLKERYNINLPKEEIGIIAIYFKMSSRRNISEQKKIGVLLMAHGRVASSVCEVTNKLLGINHARYLDMPFEKKPEEMIEEAITIIKDIDEGRGVIILVDMGSLSYFGDIISGKTGIDIRTISRFDTLLSIEVIRRAVLPDLTIYEIVDEVKGIEPQVKEKVSKYNNTKVNFRKPIILTLCITGLGGACKIKKILEENIKSITEKVDIEPIGMIEYPSLDLEIKQISNDKNVIAIVGTIDPQIANIPFFSLVDINDKVKLNQINNLIDTNQISETNKKYELSDLIHKEDIFVDLQVKSKEEVLKYMSKKLREKGYVTKNFYKKVVERDNLFPTELSDEIAIPHTDGIDVIRPAISIAILKNPIVWSKNKVKIILLLAVDQKCFNPLSTLLSFIETDEFKQIKNIKDRDFIREMILDGVNENN
ncbi:PTS operon transcription antiterminator [Clostridioides difficile]|nr:PTS operon transcription antiterminator [Clostridioides difficile]